MTRKKVIVGVSLISLLEFTIIFLSMKFCWPLWTVIVGTIVYIGLFFFAIMQLLKTQAIQKNRKIGLAIVAFSSVVVFSFGIYSLITSHETKTDILIALLLLFAGIFGFLFLFFENKNK